MDSIFVRKYLNRSSTVNCRVFKALSMSEERDEGGIGGGGGIEDNFDSILAIRSVSWINPCSQYQAHNGWIECIQKHRNNKESIEIEMI